MLETTLLILGVTVALVVFFSFVRNSVAFRLKTGADTFGHGMLYKAQNSPCPWEPCKP